ncbi:hypothetical protein [Parolsenella catena]|uniref:Pilus assembly protein n=1 Tax=Parolsenella catena TaxID=2003188 RepID=A0A3G9K6E9_9ACTN|nr:hypothetical protein [Parolsenella catena]BBH50672.1 hypothetical protein Pcatena_12590 [Parolsenella catena]
MREGKRRPSCLAVDEAGQSSVEYALVLGAFLALVLALGLVWSVVGQGGLQRASERAASHAIEGAGAVDGIRDLVLF